MGCWSQGRITTGNYPGTGPIFLFEYNEILMGCMGNKSLTLKK